MKKTSILVWGKIHAGAWHFDFKLLPKGIHHEALRFVARISAETANPSSNRITIFVHDEESGRLGLRSGKQYARLEPGSILAPGLPSARTKWSSRG